MLPPNFVVLALVLQWLLPIWPCASATLLYRSETLASKTCFVTDSDPPIALAADRKPTMAGIVNHSIAYSVETAMHINSQDTEESRPFHRNRASLSNTLAFRIQPKLLPLPHWHPVTRFDLRALVIARFAVKEPSSTSPLVLCRLVHHEPTRSRCL